jgi:hypothetical protein
MTKYLEKYDFDDNDNNNNNNNNSCLGSKLNYLFDPFDSETTIGNSTMKQTNNCLIINDNKFQADIIGNRGGCKMRTLSSNNLKNNYRLRLNKNIFKEENDIINVKKNIRFETKVSSKQLFYNYSSKEDNNFIPSCFLNRINNIKEDPRLCCSVVMARDCLHNLVFAFAITDNIIYALYGREKDDSVNASFYSLIPLINRGYENCNGVLTTHILTLDFKRIDKKNVTISWIVDGVVYYIITKPGLRTEQIYKVLECGGDAVCCTPKIFKFSFCHCSFLDFQIPNNYYRGFTFNERIGKYSITRACSGLVQLMDEKNYKELYPDVYGNYPDINPNKSFSITDEERELKHRIFGQGMETKIYYIHIIQREECEEKDEVSCSNKNLSFQSSFKILGDYSNTEENHIITDNFLTLFPQKHKEKEKKCQIIKKTIEKKEENSGFILKNKNKNSSLNTETLQVYCDNSSSNSSSK